MATAAYDATRRPALEHMRVPENVRELDARHVEALAGSIRLQGVLVPYPTPPTGAPKTCA